MVYSVQLLHYRIYTNNHEKDILRSFDIRFDQNGRRKIYTNGKCFRFSLKMKRVQSEQMKFGKMCFESWYSLLRKTVNWNRNWNWNSSCALCAVCSAQYHLSFIKFYWIAFGCFSSKYMWIHLSSWLLLIFLFSFYFIPFAFFFFFFKLLIFIFCFFIFLSCMNRIWIESSVILYKCKWNYWQTISINFNWIPNIKRIYGWKMRLTNQNGVTSGMERLPCIKKNWNKNKIIEIHKIEWYVSTINAIQTIRYKMKHEMRLFWKRRTQGILQNMNCCKVLNCNNKRIWYMHNDEYA